MFLKCFNFVLSLIPCFLPEILSERYVLRMLLGSKSTWEHLGSLTSREPLAFVRLRCMLVTPLHNHHCLVVRYLRLLSL